MRKTKEFSLGDLELKIMNVVWKNGKNVTVKDVFVELYPAHKYSYTTIMTVMSRLASKGILKVDTKQTAYIYTPAITKDEAVKKAVGRYADSLFGGDTKALVGALGV